MVLLLTSGRPLRPVLPDPAPSTLRARAERPFVQRRLRAGEGETPGAALD